MEPVASAHHFLSFERFLVILEFLFTLLLAPEAVGIALGQERSRRLALHVEAISRRLTPDEIRRIARTLVQSGLGTMLLWLFILGGLSAIIWEIREAHRAYVLYYDVLPASAKGFAAVLASISHHALDESILLVPLRFLEMSLFVLSLPTFFFAAAYKCYKAKQALENNGSNPLWMWAEKRSLEGLNQPIGFFEYLVVVTAYWLAVIFVAGRFCASLLLNVGVRIASLLLHAFAALTQPGRLRRVSAIAGLSILLFVVVARWSHN